MQRCEHCGNEFAPDIARAKRFCSERCRERAKLARDKYGKTPNSLCAICGTAFYVKPSLIRLRGNGKCCSRACLAIKHSRELRGAGSGTWRGDNANAQSGRARARKSIVLGNCEHCGASAVDRHHRDGNTLNNAPENIEALCRRCHMATDGRLAVMRYLSPAKLSPAEVRAIRSAFQEPHRGLAADLARRYSVSEGTIRRARTTSRVPQ